MIVYFYSLNYLLFYFKMFFKKFDGIFFIIYIEKEFYFLIGIYIEDI